MFIEYECIVQETCVCYIDGRLRMTVCIYVCIATLKCFKNLTGSEQDIQFLSISTPEIQMRSFIWRKIRFQFVMFRWSKHLKKFWINLIGSLIIDLNKNLNVKDAIKSTRIRYSSYHARGISFLHAESARKPRRKDLDDRKDWDESSQSFQSPRSFQ